MRGVTLSISQPLKYSRFQKQRNPCCRAVAESSSAYEWEVLAKPRLEDGGRFFVSEERIRSFEVGPNQQSDIVAIANLMQEAASNHIVALRGRSEQYYAADPELAKLDLIFVLTRMQIRMSNYPRWGDVVRTKTYFQSEGRVGARRDWTLHNACTGEPFGCATSSWVMFNYKTRRLGRMPKEVSEDYAKLMPDPPLHCIDAEETRLKLPDLPEGCPTVQHKGSPVYMDMNNHLNNTAYLTWILDSIPDDVLNSKVLSQYEVEYKAEGVAGDKVVVGSAELEELVRYSDLDSSSQPRQFVTGISKMETDGKQEELIKARTTWV